MGKLRNSLIQNLNRPGTKGLLGLIFSVIASFKQSKSVRVKYQEAEKFWVHSFKDQTFLVDLLPSFSATSQKFSKHVEETFCSYYQPKKGDVIFDIGAGVGTLIDPFLSKVGHQGHVYAVEAHPRTFSCLKSLVARNKWGQVSPLNIAISDNSEPIYINDTDNHSANSVLDEGGTIMVEGITMDALIEKEKVGRIDFIKMNIEGAERLALEQMTKTLKITGKIAVACHDQLAVESGNEYYKTKQFVIDKLESSGFEIIGQHFERVDHWVFAKRMNA